MWACIANVTGVDDGLRRQRTIIANPPVVEQMESSRPSRPGVSCCSRDGARSAGVWSGWTRSRPVHVRMPAVVGDDRIGEDAELLDFYLDHVSGLQKPRWGA